MNFRDFMNQIAQHGGSAPITAETLAGLAWECAKTDGKQEGLEEGEAIGYRKGWQDRDAKLEPLTRDQFAMAALATIQSGSAGNPDWKAGYAYTIADAMLKARANRPEPAPAAAPTAGTASP